MSAQPQHKEGLISKVVSKVEGLVKKDKDTHDKTPADETGSYGAVPLGTFAVPEGVNEEEWKKDLRKRVDLENAHRERPLIVQEFQVPNDGYSGHVIGDSMGTTVGAGGLPKPHTTAQEVYATEHALKDKHTPAFDESRVRILDHPITAGHPVHGQPVHYERPLALDGGHVHASTVGGVHPHTDLHSSHHGPVATIPVGGSIPPLREEKAVHGGVVAPIAGGVATVGAIGTDHRVLKDRTGQPKKSGIQKIKDKLHDKKGSSSSSSSSSDDDLHERLNHGGIVKRDHIGLVGHDDLVQRNLGHDGVASRNYTPSSTPVQVVHGGVIAPVVGGVATAGVIGTGRRTHNDHTGEPKKSGVQKIKDKLHDKMGSSSTSSSSDDDSRERIGHGGVVKHDHIGQHGYDGGAHSAALGMGNLAIKDDHKSETTSHEHRPALGHGIATAVPEQYVAHAERPLGYGIGTGVDTNTPFTSHGERSLVLDGNAHDTIDTGHKSVASSDVYAAKPSMLQQVKETAEWGVQKLNEEAQWAMQKAKEMTHKTNADTCTTGNQVPLTGPHAELARNPINVPTTSSGVL